MNEVEVLPQSHELASVYLGGKEWRREMRGAFNSFSMLYSLYSRGYLEKLSRLTTVHAFERQRRLITDLVLNSRKWAFFREMRGQIIGSVRTLWRNLAEAREHVPSAGAIYRQANLSL